jgi:valine--pyruvate aminotransferase
MKLSDNGRRLSAHTGIGELMRDLGEALESGGPDTVMMGGGNPAHVPGAEALWRRRLQEILAAPAALETMLGDYDGPQGRRRFLETFAAFLRRTCGYDVGPEHVAVTSSSQAGSFLLLNLLAGADGDSGRTRRILLPLVPEYIGYADQVLAEGAFLARRPRIDTPSPHRFKYRIDFDGLTVGDDVAALCLSRPTNPSTNVVTDAELAHLADLARQSDRLLIIDNAYGLPFPGIVFTPARPCPWNENVVLLFSLSKLGLPGTRTGIVVAAPAIIERLAAANAVLALANGSVGQALTEPLFASGGIESLCAEHVRPFYAERCRLAVGWLDELLGDQIPYRLHEPEGAFFLWLWLPGLPISDRELYARLKARGVIVVPGSYFFYGLPESDGDFPHRRECLRLSYGQPPDRLRRGLEILADEVRRAFGAG